MTFSDLKLAAPILKAISNCGYTEPTPVQAQAIPAALKGQDVLASAQTGTGKTAAFMLPSLDRLSTLKKGPKGAPRILVLTPTRELAQQVNDATRTYGKMLRLRTTTILGGSSYRDQFRALSQPLDLVVATPGRLIDHLERGSINLSRVEILVLDEADRMLDMGFKEAVETITDATPKERQTLLFTATLDRTMAQVATRLLKDPVRVDIAAPKAKEAKIEQRLHLTDNMGHKQRLLGHLLHAETLNQAIIFSATKKDADELAKTLKQDGHRAAALHGDMNQGARNRTLRDLRQGRIKLLVATDVAARGIDVAGISHVINYDLPKFAEDYVHRIGRTGRAGATGTAISFVSRNDRAALQRIIRYTGRSLAPTVVPGFEANFTLDPRPSKSRPSPGKGGNKRWANTKRPNEQRGTGKSKARKPYGTKSSTKSGQQHQNNGGGSVRRSSAAAYRTRPSSTNARPASSR